MFGSRNDEEVTCVACGRTLPRSDAREYDKEGNRWSRRGKEFEHLCKSCHRELCHQPRDGLESLLIDVEREGVDGRTEFLARYRELVDERYGSPERNERG